MQGKGLVAVVAAAAIAAGAGTGGAGAATTHPVLGAKLAGMGEHGVVNLHSYVKKSRLCWTFDVSTKGITAASIRDRAGMLVAKLGPRYKKKSCARVHEKVLRQVEARPGKYRVWIDTKGHPGDLRGKLFAGMAHAPRM